MRDPELLKRATALWREAYGHQMQGDLERAIELYQRSIDVYPTAEAHTFLGWTLSFQGRLEEATRECLKAIEVDPDFGNPYNDIGCYLMQQGKFEEAIPWLEKAKRAPRYEPRQFPYMNLGRIHLRQGHWWEALREFEAAVRLAPDDVELRKTLHSPRVGEAATTADVGLQDVHGAPRAELAEAPTCVLGLAARDRDSERRLDLAVAVHVLGDNGLFEPGEVVRLDLPAEADRLAGVVGVVGVDREQPVVTDRRAHRPYVPYVLVEAEAYTEIGRAHV